MLFHYFHYHPDFQIIPLFLKYPFYLNNLDIFLAFSSSLYVSQFINFPLPISGLMNSLFYLIPGSSLHCKLFLQLYIFCTYLTIEYYFTLFTASLHRSLPVAFRERVKEHVNRIVGERIIAYFNGWENSNNGKNERLIYSRWTYE